MAKPRILIVDDDEVILMILKNLLFKEGYEVIQAKNGKEAIELKDQFSFDLVITDLMMPYVNGYEVLSNFRNDASIGSIPIIILSSVGNNTAVQEVLSLGANEFIYKPFVAKELLYKVQQLLGSSF
jgi:DNA-binding response OmpR family regulator